jgi:hypothetical protein
MRRTPWLLTGLLTLLPLHTAVRAVNLEMSRLDVERALKIAAGPKDQRTRFHASYIVAVNDPIVEEIEVVTQFRRLVLKAEQEVALGHSLFKQNPDEAQAAVQPWRHRLSVVARLRFNPQSVLARIPPYVCTIGNPRVPNLNVIRTQIDPRLPAAPAGVVAPPLLGARIETVFDAARVGQTVRPVGVMLSGREVTRVTIDFSKLE